jgi:ACT domain-containing protein
MTEEDEEKIRKGPPKIPPALKEKFGAEEEAPQEKPKIPRVSFTPSGLRTPFQPSERPEAPPTLAYPMPDRRGGGGATNIIAIVALLIAIASLAFSVFVSSAQYDAIKKEAKDIASDLRALKEKDITVTAPVTATAKIDKTIPASDIFPATFYLPLDFKLPIETKLNAIDPNGRPIQFTVNDSVTVKANIPIDTTSTMAQDLLTIKQDIPVNMELTTNITIGSAYGKELDSIIGKLEKMGG